MCETAIARRSRRGDRDSSGSPGVAIGARPPSTRGATLNESIHDTGPSCVVAPGKTSRVRLIIHDLRFTPNVTKMLGVFGTLLRLSPTKACNRSTCRAQEFAGANPMPMSLIAAILCRPG